MAATRPVVDAGSWLQRRAEKCTEYVFTLSRVLYLCGWQPCPILPVAGILIVIALFHRLLQQA